MRRLCRLALPSVLLFMSLSVFAGAPLKGVDVKLGKNPGGSAARRVVSDDQGRADFGVVAAGSYAITLAMAGQSGDVVVEVSGSTTGTIRKRWNFKESKAYEENAPATARAAGQPSIAVETDGHQPLQVTVVKSKSNISNN
jgi:hypothetical protein